MRQLFAFTKHFLFKWRSSRSVVTRFTNYLIITNLHVKSELALNINLHTDRVKCFGSNKYPFYDTETNSFLWGNWWVLGSLRVDVDLFSHNQQPEPKEFITSELILGFLLHCLKAFVIIYVLKPLAQRPKSPVASLQGLVVSYELSSNML